jgi:adenylate kinase family enzyme
MGDCDGGSCEEYSEGHMTVNNISKFAAELESKFSLPSVKLSSILLSRDHNKRANEVREHMAKRRNKEVLIVDIHNEIYSGRIDDLRAETYSIIMGGDGYSSRLHALNGLKYMEVGALFYVDVN